MKYATFRYDTIEVENGLEKQMVSPEEWFYYIRGIDLNCLVRQFVPSKLEVQKRRPY